MATPNRPLRAQRIDMHRLSLDSHRDFLARDDQEITPFKVAEEMRIDAAIVIRQGSECIAVIAIPRVRLFGRYIPVAPRAVRMQVAPLKDMDIQFVRELADQGLPAIRCRGRRRPGATRRKERALAERGKPKSRQHEKHHGRTGGSAPSASHPLPLAERDA
jgi:hypothetical protein